MGGKGGKGDTQTVNPMRMYDPQYLPTLENMATGMALGTAVKQNPALAGLAGGFGGGTPGIPGMPSAPGASSPSYGKGAPAAGQATRGQAGLAQYGMNLPSYQPAMKALTGGTTLSGQKIPEYQKGPSFQFKTPDISNIPQQAYSRAMDVGMEGISRAQQQAGAQAQRGLASRGVARGGLAQGAGAGLARQAMQQGADLSRNLGMAQAQEQLATDKLRAQMGMQTQASQAAENLARGGMDLDAMRTLGAMQQGQLGAYGSLAGAQQNQAMLPYQMITGLYGQNLSIPAYQQQVIESGKGDPFGALMGAAGTIAPAAIAACLPKGTKIELEDGSDKLIEDFRGGEKVRGGEVIALQRIKRGKDHKFFEHRFINGKSVVMSDGHPYAEPLQAKMSVGHDSEYTYDILTTLGHYYINGVKILSTMRIK